MAPKGIDPPTGGFLSKFKHAWWRWVLSALAGFGSTLATDLLRVICLLIAVVSATWAYHHDFQRGSGQRPVLQVLDFCFWPYLFS